jgi:hypothetical protein
LTAIPAALLAMQMVVGLLTASGPADPPPLAHRDCFKHPSRCGYPDATNTGVPPGTRLRPSGSITVSRDGATLSGLRVRGAVTVAADDVTIRDSRITQGDGGSGSYAIILNEGADGFTIMDSEVAGPRSRSAGLQSAVWNHYGNPGATAIRSFFHRCADCWEGAGTFRHDYIVVDAAYADSHDENIYVCGGSVDVGHSTLINRNRQTATVFGDTSGCGGNSFKVTDSLLAGGGFLLYPQANSGRPVGSMNISDNHFARCRTAPVYDEDSGGTTCSGGGDGHGIFPNGGYFGVAAYYYRGKNQIWMKNVWDDNLRPACPQSTC